VPGTPNTLPKRAYTMGQLFKSAGYATAIYGKWHLGKDPESLPGAHGFDDFYGIPPDATWNIALDVPQVQQTHSIEAPEKALVDKGPWIMSQRAAGALQRVKPFTPEVRAEIDNELTDKSIAFMKAQHEASRRISNRSRSTPTLSRRTSPASPASDAKIGRRGRVVAQQTNKPEINRKHAFA